MIMQEFIVKKSSTTINKKHSNKKMSKIDPLDNFEILVSNRSTVPSFSNSSFSLPKIEDNIQSINSKPFPYLKRKSIRVDIILKQEKLAQLKKNNSPIQKLKNEKKKLELENYKLKSKLLNLEKQFSLLISGKSQKKVTFKQENCECTKCHMSINSKYVKYHKRICGNLNLNRILNENDLKRLNFIRKSNHSILSIKPKNNWRRKRQEFISQLKQSKMNYL